MIARAAVVVALAVLAGCATVPDVDYHQLGPGPHHDAWIPFRLTDSIIVIGAPPKAKGDATAVAPVDLTRSPVRCPGPVCDALAIAAVPTDFRGPIYAIQPRSRRLVSTSTAPAYFPNSLRLKTLTIEAKDHRLEAINTVAAIAGEAAKFGAHGMDLSNADPTDTTAVLMLPIAIPLAALRCDVATADCTPMPAPRPLPGNPPWTYTAAFVDDPAASGLMRRSELETVHSAMVASVCRPLRLVLRQATTNATVTLDTDVADPDWLTTVPFPVKGALTFHTLCGIDVQPQAVTEIGVDAMAAAFAKGVDQVVRHK